MPAIQNRTSKGRTDTVYKIKCNDVVCLLEFCPYEWASHLLAIGTNSRITIGSCRFPEEDPDIDDIEYQDLSDVHHDTRITAFSWCPTTSTLAVPKVVRFCTAGADRKIQMFSSDLDAECKKVVLGQHRDYVNAVSVHPEKGEHVASISDDHTCKVWASTGGEVACFPLNAPGMAVCWHPEHKEKLLVAEKRGVLRMYNFLSQQPVLSLDCGQVPLTSADWYAGNALLVAATAGTDWLIFDTSRSSCPLENKAVHSDGTTNVKWSRSQRHLLATTGQPNSQLKVTNVHINQVIFSKDHIVSSGLTWHHRLPLLAVGSDNMVHVYKVES